MAFMLVFVAGNPASPLTPGHLAEAEGFLDENALRYSTRPRWLDIHKAAEIGLTDKPSPEQMTRLRNRLEPDTIDIFITNEDFRRKKLLIADMDATIVTGETLDELADCAGLKEQIAIITERAMRGELDFSQALAERVSMLKGLPVSALQKTLDKTSLSHGAETLVRTMRYNGATCVLVSGGFTFFTKPISQRAGFSFHHGNTLEIANECLTGQVKPPLLDKYAKLKYLEEYRDRMNLLSDEVIAVGDGANDLPMLENAGLGLGYKPKPLLLERLENCIVHTDLTSALYIQGYTGEEITRAMESRNATPTTSQELH